MPNLMLRDRDAIVTSEGLIFRVLGYSHPPNAYICDAEYAPENHFRSSNPKAPRTKDQHNFYKFYEDEAWKFLKDNFPKYLIYHDMIRRKIIGVNQNDMTETRKPDEELARLIKTKPKDELLAALQDVVKFVTQQANLPTEAFGIFGSILHGFYHQQYSDLDFIIYGRPNTLRLRKTLKELYSDSSSMFKNEFENDEPIRGKRWRFKNLSPKEFVWHQRRKLIYSLFKSQRTGRIIKTEFEPVKQWNEIINEYDTKARISQKGWVKMLARVIRDDDGPFMPSTYDIKPSKIIRGAKSAGDVTRVVSYMEEFRMQACKDETVYVEGNLEEVETPNESFAQVSLTYCPRYYEQVLKVSTHT